MDTVSSPRWPRRVLGRLHPWRELGDAWRRLRFRHAVHQLSEHIRIDLSEDERAYTVLASLPGAHKDDIEVMLEGKRVRISAETCAEQRQGAGSALRCERYVGRRRRTLVLDREIDPARGRAEYRNGVLRLDLPKLSPPRGTPIPVR